MSQPGYLYTGVYIASKVHALTRHIDSRHANVDCPNERMRISGSRIPSLVKAMMLGLSLRTVLPGGVTGGRAGAGVLDSVLEETLSEFSLVV